MRGILAAVSIAALLAVQGCSGVGLTLLGAGAGAGATAGVTHTMNGTTSKTFTASAADVEMATMAALEDMAIDVGATATGGDSRSITASARDRTVEIQLEPITGSATLMQVTVKEEFPFMRDRATGDEIIVRTENRLRRQIAAGDGDGQS